jgi:uncharacterized membrane protein YGL010W
MMNWLYKGRSIAEWLAEYSAAHRHPVNRYCHTWGIPLVVVSIPGALAGFLWPPLWIFSAMTFGVGWALQFIGHAFEGKPPEFFKDWRFLLIGMRWWWAKVRGRV